MSLNSVPLKRKKKCEIVKTCPADLKLKSVVRIKCPTCFGYFFQLVKIFAVFPAKSPGNCVMCGRVKRNASLDRRFLGRCKVSQNHSAAVAQQGVTATQVSRNSDLSIAHAVITLL